MTARDECRARFGPGPCIKIYGGDDMTTVTATRDCIGWCPLLNTRLTANPDFPYETDSGLSCVDPLDLDMPISPPVHCPEGFQSLADRRAAYDAARPASPYDRRRWRKLRATYLATHPLCECGCGYPATVVDHKIPHLGNAALMYAWDNLQAMAKACHDRKTAAVDGGFGHPTRRTYGSR